MLTGMARVHVPHSSHWGAFEAEVADGTVIAIHPYRHDPDPSPLLGNIVDGLRDRARIAQPMVHAGSVARTNGVWPSPDGGGAGWGVA
jgi:biotin/methionine sulfoxide reductase